MSRTTTAAVDTAFAGDNVPLVLFLQMEFDSGTSRVTNAAYDITWNGSTWTGVGALGSFEAIR